MIKMEKVKPLFYLPKFKAQKYKYNFKKNEHLSQKMLFTEKIKESSKIKACWGRDMVLLCFL